MKTSARSKRSATAAPHLFGGFAEYLYLLPNTPMFKVPEILPDDVAVLTELFAVTHSLELAAKMPRPAGFRPEDTVAVVGVGPVGVIHAAKAALMGASRVIGIDQHPARLRLVPGGADVVVDATGHPSSFGTALAAGDAMKVVIRPSSAS